MREAITVMYFAWVREQVGVASEVIVPPQTVNDVADLIAWLRTCGPKYEHAFSRPDVIRTAINQSHVKNSAKLDGAREIAFFPPVTGG